MWRYCVRLLSAVFTIFKMKILFFLLWWRFFKAEWKSHWSKIHVFSRRRRENAINFINKCIINSEQLTTKIKHFYRNWEEKKIIVIIILWFSAIVISVCGYNNSKCLIKQCDFLLWSQKRNEERKKVVKKCVAFNMNVPFSAEKYKLVRVLSKVKSLCS